MRLLLLALCLSLVPAHALAAAPKKGRGKAATTTAPAPAAPKAVEAKPADPVPEAKPEPAAPAPEVAPTPAPAPEAAAPSRTKIRRVAVLDPEKKAEVPERPYLAFSNSLVSEVRKLRGLSVIGMADVREMLAFEKQRSLLGCGDDSCLAEIGGSLGVDEIVSSTLTLVGNSYSLTIKRLDMRKSRAVQNLTKSFAKRDGEELMSIVGPLVAELYPEAEFPMKEGRTRGVDQAVIRRLNPPPLPRWVFGVTLGAGVVAAGAGAFFGNESKQAENEWNDSVSKSSLTSPVEGSRLATLEKDAKQNADLANIFFGVAGGLAVVAAVEAFFTDWNPVTVSIGPGGVGVAGTF